MDSPVDRLGDYEFRHLVSHLAKSGAIDDLHRLLALVDSKGRNAWFEAREKRGDASAYLDDIGAAHQIADSSATSGGAADAEIAVALAARYALVVTSFNSMAGNYLPGLAASLVANGRWTSDQALTYAAHGLEPEVQVETIVSALKLAKGERVDFLARQALAAVAQVMPDDTRGVRLGDLVAQLPPGHLGAAISLAGDIENEGSRLGALRALAPRLPEELLPQAWELAQAISQVGLRAEAMAALATRFSGSSQAGHIRSVLDIVRQEAPSESFGSDWRSQVLERLAEQVPEDLLSEILDTAKETLGTGYELVNVLTAAIGRAAATSPLDVLDSLKKGPNTPAQWNALIRAAEALAAQGEGAQALAAASAIEEPNSQAEALGKLAAVLPSSLQEALYRAIETLDEEFRGDPLAKLAQHAHEALLPKLLQGALAMHQGSERCKAVAAVASRLPEDRRYALLDDEIDSLRQSSSSNGLRYLAPVLSPDQLPRALAILQGSDDFDRSDEAASLLQRWIVLGLPSEALSAASALPLARERAACLSSIAEQLSPELILQAYELARAIGDDAALVSGCAPLAPSLPGHLVDDLLERARRVHEPRSRIKALGILVDRLDPTRRRHALEEALRTVQELDVHRTSDIRQALKEIASEPQRRIPYDLLRQAMHISRMRLPPNDQLRLWINFVRALRKSRVPPGSWHEVFEDALARTEEYGEEGFVVGIASCVPRPLVQALVVAAANVRDETLRAAVLSGVVTWLPSACLELAHAPIAGMISAKNRSTVLVQLVPRLPVVARATVVDAELNRWSREELANSDLVSDLIPLLRFAGDRGRSPYEASLRAALYLKDLSVKAARLMYLAVHAPRALRLRTEKLALETCAMVQTPELPSLLQFFAPWISRRGLPAAIVLASNLQQNRSLELADTMAAIVLRAARVRSDETVVLAFRTMTNRYDREAVVKDVVGQLSLSALVELAPLVEGEALAAIANALVKKGRVVEARGLIPRLSDYERGPVITEMCTAALKTESDSLMNEVRKLTDPRWKSAALAALAKGDDAIFLDAVGEACSIESPHDRIEAFRAIGRASDNIPRQIATVLWCRTLDSFQNRKRADAFDVLGAMGLHPSEALGRGFASRLFEAVTDVSASWP